MFLRPWLSRTTKGELAAFPDLLTGFGRVRGVGKGKAEEGKGKGRRVEREGRKGRSRGWCSLKGGLLFALREMDASLYS